VNPFTKRVKRIVKSIPAGKVATYGQVASLAGNERAARGVAWILHACSGADRLPWHRVVNCRGSISLPRGRGCEEQKRLLKAEGIGFDRRCRIDLDIFLWEPRDSRDRAFAAIIRELRKS